MSVEIVVPNLGESVTEATVATWFIKEGEGVAADQPVCELETDKVTMEVVAPASGTLEKITVGEGDTVEVGAVLGSIKEGAAPAKSDKKEEKKQTDSDAEYRDKNLTTSSSGGSASGRNIDPVKDAGPAARKLMEEKNISGGIAGSGKDGRITKGDVLNAPAGSSSGGSAGAERKEERVKMSKLRQVIAKRLKESQETAAILTTFNEIDMTNVMALRNEYKDAFEKKHGQRLGFMGFFVKAVCHALKEIPAVNASIEGNEIIYRNFCDVGVAVGTDQGLVVPVIRNADQMSILDIEVEIARLAKKAREGTLAMADLQGGTFTVSNGGVYGSLMSTPIINPPQSGILGMHKTEKRPVVVNDQIVIRPMMYVALSYDHRIIDGKESVTFLVRVKEGVEDPRRLLLGL